MMKKIRQLTAAAAAVVMAMAPAVYATEAETQQMQSSDITETDAVLKVGSLWQVPSLDTHTDYNGWYTSIFGISQALFTMNENLEVAPCLAEDAVEDGKTWTVTLNKDAAFSNGDDVNSDIVIENLKRCAEKNERFAYFGDYEYGKVDDDTFTITTPEVYPTLKNDLASPELGIIDLDATEDTDNAPICTGPFTVSSFTPNGDVSVVRNENYWDGNVSLAGADFLYLDSDDALLMAMQNGEIDCYNGVTADALQIYQQSPDDYKVVSTPGTRLQFYILNNDRLDDKAREAVNLVIDKDLIAEYLKGVTSRTDGPFSPNAAYGKAKCPAADPEKAKSLLEEDGYEPGSDGFYEKDGEKLSLNIACYAARSLDTIATLMQSQLKDIGVDSTITIEEDPDSTYISTGDFDIALYCMVADKAGDPGYFIDSTIKQGSAYNCGHYVNDEVEKNVTALEQETDAAKRADLANQIIQTVIDDNAYGYIGLFNNITVEKPGVSGYAENYPYDFYGLFAYTTMS